MFNRLPIRIRLTAVFLAVMLSMIFAGGIVVRSAVTRSIDQSINAGLKSRVDDLASRARTSGATLVAIPPRTLVSEESSFAQVLAQNGTIITSSERFAGEPLLTKDEVQSALVGTLIRDLKDGHEGRPIRIIASSTRFHGQPAVVVAGTALDVRAKTRKDLTLLLWIGGAIAALLASLVGYFLAALALGAVDRMRAAADQIDATSLGERIPVPPARDELQRLSLTFNALLDRVESAFAHERQFIARASHELRTPIAIIKTELELALAGAGPLANLDTARDRVSVLEQRIESAEAETDRLGQLATALLHSSPATAGAPDGSLRITKAEVSLESLIDSVQYRFSERARRSGRGISHAITARASAGPTDVVVDRLRIEQAIANLVENSLQHGTGDISLELDRDDDHWLITVTDQATGVPPAARPGSSVSPSPSAAVDATARTGLGLQLVREIMQAHGGDLTFTTSGMPTLQFPS